MGEQQSVWLAIVTSAVTLLTLIITKLFEMQQRRDDREYEMRKMEREREHRSTLMEKLDVNTEITASTLKQVAASQGKTVDQATQESDDAFEGLMSRYRGIDGKNRTLGSGADTDSERGDTT